MQQSQPMQCPMIKQAHTHTYICIHMYMNILIHMCMYIYTHMYSNSNSARRCNTSAR